MAALAGVVEHGSAAAQWLRTKALEAQVCLLRGYLHEVNNALAGIGTLAEILPQMSAESLRRNGALMVETTRRAAQLQRRIRALYTATEVPLPCAVAGWLERNKDLVALTLGHGYKLTWGLTADEETPELKEDRLWRWLMVALEAWKSLVATGGQAQLRATGKTVELHIHEPKELPGVWQEALQLAAAEVAPGAHVRLAPGGWRLVVES